MTATNEEYEKALLLLHSKGSTVNPRGLKVKELLCYTMKIENPIDNIITIKNFETNLKYAQEELHWYLSTSNKIDYSELIKRTWKKYSDDGETVNSAYGHRIWELIKILLINGNG